jgi:hypothetical protein
VVGEARLEVALSRIDDSKWLVQIAGLPSAIRPLVVKRTTVTACSDCAYQVATTVHEQLTRDFQTVFWAIDAIPTEATGHRLPVAPTRGSA